MIGQATLASSDNVNFAKALRLETTCDDYPIRVPEPNAHSFVFLSFFSDEMNPCNISTNKHFYGVERVLW